MDTINYTSPTLQSITQQLIMVEIKGNLHFMFITKHIQTVVTLLTGTYGKVM